MKTHTSFISKMRRSRKSIGLIVGGSVLILCFQNCGFAVKDLSQLTGESESNLNSSNKVATCIMDVDKTTVHFGETYSFSINKPEDLDSLPAQVKLRAFGTKSKLDGSGKVADADGLTSAVVDVAELKNLNSGDMAGDYSRHFEILDPQDDHVICKTNTIHFALTPVCPLSVETTSVPLGQQIGYQLSTAEVVGEPTQADWYEFQIEPASATKVTSAMGTADAILGSATGPISRFVDIKDPNGKILCRSNTIQVTVYGPNPDSFGEGGNSDSGVEGYQSGGSEGYGGSSEGGGEGYGGSSSEGGNQGGGGDFGGGSSSEGGGGDIGGGL